MATCKGDKPLVAKAWQAEKVPEEVLDHLRPAEDIVKGSFLLHVTRRDVRASRIKSSA